MSGKRLVRSVLRLGTALTRLERQVAARSDLSVSQGRILSSLGRSEDGERGMRTGDLAESQGLAISTMTRNLDLLERKGWVLRVKDSEDGRSVRVQLTDAGKKLSEEFYRATQGQLAKAFDGFHPSDSIERAVALSKVAKALEDVAEA